MTKTVTVPVTGDALDEDDERFFLKLSNAGNAAVGNGQGVGTIVEDDPLPDLSITDVSVTEGDAGTSANVLFTVKLSAPSAKPVSVAYATANGTAVAPDDYSAITGATLSFAPGETTKSIAMFSTATISVRATRRSSWISPTPSTPHWPTGRALAPSSTMTKRPCWAWFPGPLSFFGSLDMGGRRSDIMKPKRPAMTLERCRSRRRAEQLAGLQGD